MSVEADSTPCKPSPSARPGVGADGLSTGEPATVTTAARVKTEPSSTTAGAGAAAAAAAAAAEGARVAGGGEAAAGGVKSGIDQEMGELSELFAPDAFLQSTVLDTEMEVAGAGAGRAARSAASAIGISIEPTATEQPPVPCGGSPAAPDAMKAAEAAAAAAAQTAAAAVAPVVVKAEHPPPSPATAATVTPAASPTPETVSAGAAAAAPAAAGSSRKEECRCGQAACPSLLSAARKRPMADISSSTAGGGGAGGGAGGGTPGAPLSLGTGMSYAGLSSRQRKRQRSLAPVLSAPRTVSYECSLCKESYPSEISSNPWWSLFLHECPRCHRMQIPRVDAASAAVSVDYIHAVCAEEGEGYDSDG